MINRGIITGRIIPFDIGWALISSISRYPDSVRFSAAKGRDINLNNNTLIFQELAIFIYAKSRR